MRLYLIAITLLIAGSANAAVATDRCEERIRAVHGNPDPRMLRQEQVIKLDGQQTYILSTDTQAQAVCDRIDAMNAPVQKERLKVEALRQEVTRAWDVAGDWREKALANRNFFSEHWRFAWLAVALYLTVQLLRLIIWCTAQVWKRRSRRRYHSSFRRPRFSFFG